MLLHSISDVHLGRKRTGHRMLLDIRLIKAKLPEIVTKGTASGWIIVDHLIRTFHLHLGGFCHWLQLQKVVISIISCRIATLHNFGGWYCSYSSHSGIAEVRVAMNRHVQTPS